MDQRLDTLHEAVRLKGLAARREDREQVVNVARVELARHAQ